MCDSSRKVIKMSAQHTVQTLYWLPDGPYMAVCSLKYMNMQDKCKKMQAFAVLSLFVDTMYCSAHWLVLPCTAILHTVYGHGLAPAMLQCKPTLGSSRWYAD